MSRHHDICRSKKAWSTETKARVHALGVMNHPVRQLRSTHPIHVYCCPVCGMWHLTSVSPQEWRKREAMARRACQSA